MRINYNKVYVINELNLFISKFFVLKLKYILYNILSFHIITNIKVYINLTQKYILSNKIKEINKIIMLIYI